MARGPGITPSGIPHREGTRACTTDVKATDLTVQDSLWAGPPRPSIAHYDWLITISNFSVLCTLSLALEKTTAADDVNQPVMINLSNTEYVPFGKFINVTLDPVKCQKTIEVQLTFCPSRIYDFIVGGLTTVFSSVDNAIEQAEML